MLDQETLDMLAERCALRVVELLEERQLVGAGGLVDAATLASHLGVDRSWVYEHADELGARRLGEGPRARLRFDLDAAEQATACLAGSKSEQPASRTTKPKQRRRRARPLGTEAPLLPVRGARRASDG
jgi:hypothetical protein